MFTRFAARRFRCFRDWQSVELGQLTLIYGENGAGKSALLRLLPWLAASSRWAGHGLQLGWDGLHGAGWRDLCWRGDAPSLEREGWWGDDPEKHDNPTLSAAVELRPAGGGGPVGAAWRTRWWDPPGLHRLDVVDLWGPARHRFSFADARAMDVDVHSYEIDGRPAPVRFDGLLPPAAAAPGAPVDAVASALRGVSWLGPRRVGPTRAGEVRGREVAFGPDGAGAQTLALRDAALRERVSRWYREHTGAEVHHSGLGAEADRLVLVRSGAGDVPFPDTGEGLQQAFPVLVALERLRDRGGLLAVEEPESHLHPRLQRGLADRLGDVLAAQPEAQVLIETHSEVLLVAAMREALRRGLQLRLHWVSAGDDGAARVREIKLDAGLRPEDDTLVQAFSVMGALRKEVIELRRDADAARAPIRGAPHVG